MTLLPDPSEKGLWRNPNLPKPMRGAHALILGISRYSFLGGIVGNDAWNTGGLGQLAVSAGTAAKLFRWIDLQGAFGGTAIASCRVLLSPAPEEQGSIDLLTGKNHRSANYTDIEESMRAWGDDIIASTVGTDANVALFFFSGHGIERAGRHHLLAQDVLKPDSASGRQNAIEVDPILTALSGFGINTGFLLLDACRNDSDDARKLGIEGRSVLVPQMEALSDPTALTVFKATGSGKVAYQRPTDHATIFGQAVLESLEGLPPEFVPYDRQANPWKLATAALDKFVKQHVRQQLALILSNTTQPVQVWGRPYDETAVVALRPPPDGVAAPLAKTITVPREISTGQGGSGAPPESQTTESTTGSVGQTPQAALSQRTAHAFSHFQRISSPTLNIEGSVDSQATMREILLHDDLISHWLGTLKVMNADSGEPITASTLRISQAHRAESSELVTVWLDILVPRDETPAFWVQLGNAGDNVCAVILPSDRDEEVPVRLDVTYIRKAKDSVTARLHSMTARIGEPHQEASYWQGLWDAQREEQVEGLGAALATLDRTMDWMYSSDGVLHVSPVVNAATWTLLLRGGRLPGLDRLYSPYASRGRPFPDLAILYIETHRLLHEYKIAPLTKEFLERLFKFFVGATQVRRLPRFSQVLDMAARQIAFFESCGLDDDLTDSGAFRHGANAILTASDYSRSDSLYTALASENGLPHFFDSAVKQASDSLEGAELAVTA